MKIKNLIAYCGINCGECDIYLAPSNLKISEDLVKKFKGMWDNVKPEDFHCDTCKGNLSLCWTEKCEIRDCCTEKKIEFCSQCNQFPCEVLKNWSKKSERYAEALERLYNIGYQKDSNES
ncbi:MAG: DUF3795 domain-containing protein [Candidatus Lokiarchaeota archaeon]